MHALSLMLIAHAVFLLERRRTDTQTRLNALPAPAAMPAWIMKVKLMTSLINWQQIQLVGWLRGSVAERRSLAGELSLFCARPVVDG